jgi:hypothetical protein
MKIQVMKAIEQGVEVVIKNSIILKVIIVNAILNCIFSYLFLYAPGLAGPRPGPEAYPPQLPEHFWLYTILVTLISWFLTLIITKMVYDATKSNVLFSEAVSLSARRFIFVFIATILYSLIVIVGIIALIIPGVFLSIKFAFITYFILLNNEKIIDSFKKSWQITEGNWWEVFGLLLIFMIPIMILSMIASGVALISIPITLAIDFAAVLLSGWLVSTLTIAYIQLTEEGNKEAVIKAQ